MNRVPVLWAVYSKLPGDTDDYRVLACSPDCRPRFEELLGTDRPGTPATTEEGRPDSLPWVTFGRADAGQVALSVMSWSGDADVARRPITRTHVFVGDVGGVLATSGFLVAHRATAPVELPARDACVDLVLDSAAVRRPAPALPPGVVPGWAARVAALVLEGRVIVTGTGAWDVETRLAVVDAVAALLPVGYRRSLTVATWAAAPDRRPQRLCFGPEPGTKAVEVRLDAAPEPRTTAGQDYLHELAKWVGPSVSPRLLAHLGAADPTVGFDAGPDPAVEFVQRLDLPAVLLAEIRAGRGRPTVVAGLVEHGDPAKLWGADVGEVHRFLLTHLEEGHAALLARWWSAELAEAVVWAVRYGLAPDRAARCADDFLTTLARPKHRDELLARLLVTVEGRDASPELRQVGLRAIRRERQLPLLRAALLADDQVGACTGLVGEAQETYPDDVPGLVGWLIAGAPRDAEPAWLAVLDRVVSPRRRGRPVTPELVDEAEEQYPGVVLMAFVRASARRDLAVLGPALWVRLVDGAAQRRDSPLQQAIGRHLPTGVAAAADAASRAWVDVALVAAGDAPRAVSSDAAQAVDYVTGWDTALAALSKQVAPTRGTPPPDLGAALRPTMPAAVVTTLLDRPGGEGVRAAALVVAEVVRLPRRWPPELVGRTVARLVEHADGAALLPMMAGHAGQPWAALVQNDPYLRRSLPRLELRVTAGLRDTTPEDLAGPWATLVTVEGLTPQERVDLAELAHWPFRAAPNAVLELVEATVARLTERRRYPEEALARWRDDTLTAIVRGSALGPVAAERTVAALAFAAADVERDKERQIARLDGERERLRQEIAAMKQERKEVKRRAKRERLRLIPLIGPAAAGVPWWSWRRWWAWW